MSLYSSWVQTFADCCVHDTSLKPIMAQAFVKLSKGDKADGYYEYILLFVGPSLCWIFFLHAHDANAIYSWSVDKNI